ncbi:YqaJ viral recombinase family protein [Halomonas sp. I5-271120]|uniref:YqaJ viral recombinase family protein n=1 Tax=Halomonas sp. I5-271120 TaxID=3061632 RepID=UPI002714A804|nr:YqaJ viral recombinase family protein [Halomonas sp. I5-271120]
MRYEIVHLEQGSSKWHAWRKEGITATDAVVLAGVSPYKSEWRLWGEKRGIVAEPDLGGNPYVRRGNELEPEARDHMADFLLEIDPTPEAYAAARSHFKEALTPYCIQMVKYPMLRASLDGLRDNGEPTELKVPSSRTFEDVVKRGRQSKAYRLYYPQVQHQIMVTGAARGWLLFYQPDQDSEPVCFEIRRDDDFLKAHMHRCGRFYKKLQEGDPPVKDHQKDVYYPTDADEAEAWYLHAPAAYRLEKQRQALKRQVESIEEALSHHKEALAICMGDFKTGEFGGVRLNRSQKKGSVQWEQLIEQEFGESVTEEMRDRHRKATQGGETRRLTVTEKGMPREILDPDARQWLEGCVDEEGFVDYPQPSLSGYF